MSNEFLKLYGHVIKVYDTPYPSGKIIKFFVWENFPLDTFVRWKWYFEYRYALLRIQYPKNYIYSSQFHLVYNPDKVKNHYKNLLRSAKAKITEFSRKKKFMEEDTSELFPAQSNLRYVKICDRLDRAEKKLEELLKLKENE